MSQMLNSLLTRIHPSLSFERKSDAWVLSEKKFSTIFITTFQLSDLDGSLEINTGLEGVVIPCNDHARQELGIRS